MWILFTQPNGFVIHLCSWLEMQVTSEAPHGVGGGRTPEVASHGSLAFVKDGEDRPKENGAGVLLCLATVRPHHSPQAQTPRQSRAGESFVVEKGCGGCCRLGGWKVGGVEGAELCSLWSGSHLFVSSVSHLPLKFKGKRCGYREMKGPTRAMGRGRGADGWGRFCGELALRRRPPQVGTEHWCRRRLAPSDRGGEHLYWHGGLHGDLGVQSSPALLCLPKVPHSFPTSSLPGGVECLSGSVSLQARSEAPGLSVVVWCKSRAVQFTHFKRMKQWFWVYCSSF